MAVQIVWISQNRSSLFSIIPTRPWSFLLISSKIFSIMLMSGQWAGQLIVVMPFLWTMYRRIVILKYTLIVWKMLSYHRPQIVVDNLLVFLCITIAFNCCNCSDSVPCNATLLNGVKRFGNLFMKKCYILHSYFPKNDVNKWYMKYVFNPWLGMPLECQCYFVWCKGHFIPVRSGPSKGYIRIQRTDHK